MKTKIIALILGAVILTAFQQNTSADAKTKKGMIKVTILYPNGDGKTFDMDYYSNKHMPMLKTLMGDSLKLLEIDKGISGRTPDEPIPYLAIGYLYFDKLSAYQNSFGPNAEKIVGDIPNYTNIQPIVQISEVLQ
ncbi:EthD family reductase [Ulvibacterium marinum]|uniref:EthD family reductase n=1 Tax=Ulvibacterium marinum TaxID=2419782 RepID=A0A3B0C1H9_9FLAO|nr:EthD family reductase [Ulvibacterium marinum]RKN78498.1 EthD family reductase [Ulvibacterium marinum]